MVTKTTYSNRTILQQDNTIVEVQETTDTNRNRTTKKLQV